MINIISFFILIVVWNKALVLFKYMCSGGLYLCLYNNIFVDINPASTLPNTVLSGNDMVCSAYLAVLIQTETDPFRSPECTAHSFMLNTSPAFALSHSLAHFLSLFIYLPGLLSNRAAKWSTAAVSQPAVVLTRDGRTDDIS